MAVDVIVLSQCKKEIDEFPLQIREELLDAIEDLREGIVLAMPLSRKMQGMEAGIFELRFKDSFGSYRVIYFVRKKDAIYLVHAFQKKTEKTSQKNIAVTNQRIKRYV